MTWLGPLLEFVNALLDKLFRAQRAARIDDVRSNPGSAWVRKMGGKDGRSSGPENSGGDSDG